MSLFSHLLENHRRKVAEQMMPNMNQTCHIWIADWALSEDEAKAKITGDTVTMVDTIHTDVEHIPQSTQKVAGYVTGSAEIIWIDPDWNRFANVQTGKVRINQAGSNGYLGDVLDIESGAWSIDNAAEALSVRAKDPNRDCAAYVDEADYDALITALKGKGFTSFPTVAVQWASPSSNPTTILPGSSLTLSEANCDLSVALATWFGPSEAPPPPKQSEEVVIKGNDLTETKVTVS